MTNPKAIEEALVADLQNTEEVWEARDAFMADPTGSTWRHVLEAIASRALAALSAPSVSNLTEPASQYCARPTADCNCEVSGVVSAAPSAFPQLLSNQTQEKNMLDVNTLAAHIRRIDGDHNMGSAELAENLMPIIQAEYLEFNRALLGMLTVHVADPGHIHTLAMRKRAAELIPIQGKHIRSTNDQLRIERALRGEY